MTVEELKSVCDSAARDLALFFVREPEDRAAAELRKMRTRLEVCLAVLLGAEATARFFEAFVAEVWRRTAEIEDSAGVRAGCDGRASGLHNKARRRSTR